jgi:hypothetical protein
MIKMTDKEFIIDIKPLDSEKYLLISSREKLIAYTISYLVKNKVQTSFNNICVSSYKLFPEKFKLSEEFPEYPHLEMLNRTLLHILPKQLDYATGSARIDYRLTQLGEIIAKQVENDLLGIRNIKISKKEIIDKHKTGQKNDYEKFKLYINNHQQKIFDNDLDLIWNYFAVTPFTQSKKLVEKLEKIEQFSSSIKDYITVEIIKKIINLIR